MLVIFQVVWVAFAAYLAWFCATELKKFPRGILEYAVWAVALLIIFSWAR